MICKSCIWIIDLLMFGKYLSWRTSWVSCINIAVTSFSWDTPGKRSSIPYDFQQFLRSEAHKFLWSFRQVSQVRLYNSFVRCTLGNKRRICFKGIVFNTSLVPWHLLFSLLIVIVSVFYFYSILSVFYLLLFTFC